VLGFRQGSNLHLERSVKKPECEGVGDLAQQGPGFGPQLRKKKKKKERNLSETTGGSQGNRQDYSGWSLDC